MKTVRLFKVVEETTFKMEGVKEVIEYINNKKLYEDDMEYDVMGYKLSVMEGDECRVFIKKGEEVNEIHN